MNFRFFISLMLSVLLLGAIAESSGHTVSSESAVRFPGVLVCRYQVLPEGTRQEKQILYTRLQKVTNLSKLSTKELTVWEQSGNDRPKHDEAAAAPWSGGYYGASINQETYSYRVWSCDSEDREYSFKTNDLAVAADSKIKSKVVSGVVRIEVRSEGEDFPLTCVARY